MRLFALETDTEKFKRQYLLEGERELLTIRFHGFKFFVEAFWTVVLALAIIATAVGAWYLGMQGWLATALAGGALLVFVFPRLLRAYIDWRYDFAFVTTDKAVLVDQSSLFRQRVTPVNLENFASVSTATQFWNLFPFGTLRFHLKSGLGEDLVLPYTAHADKAAAQIANAVTEYQRRKDLRRYGEGEGGRTVDVQ